jgi:hypothetical protein
MNCYLLDFALVCVGYYNKIPLSLVAYKQWIFIPYFAGGCKFQNQGADRFCVWQEAGLIDSHLSGRKGEEAPYGLLYKGIHSIH